jgi:DNA primase
LTVEKLKEYIYQENKIEFILESIGCYSIKYHQNKDYFTCANYNGDNTTAIRIKNNNYLNCDNYTRKSDFDDNSDIITLVQYNKNIKFVEAIKYLHQILGLKFTYEVEVKHKEEIDPLYIFKKVKSKKNKLNVLDFEILDEEILNDFIPYIHISWFKEGVMPWTVKKFGLGYSYKQKRIIVPMRYWLTGELLGTNARTTLENYELFDIKKYFITPSYPKSYNLFGLWEHKEDIQRLGYCTVFESEKSTLKRDSLNDFSGVSLSGHTISDEQIRILIGLNVDIIISLDKDIPIEEVRYMCSRFYGIRNVYYIYDKYDLLKSKDSPADVQNKIYEFLFKYKIKYNETEHNEYLKSLERKNK